MRKPPPTFGRRRGDGAAAAGIDLDRRQTDFSIARQ
jgi:hypothetical protein